MPLYQSESKQIMNLDFERKKELDRRRTLRILQVRQQSKDLARVIRENCKEEENDRRHKFLQCKTKQLHTKKTDHLRRLQELYEICLDNIGESHREAANQPDYILTRQLEVAEKNAKAVHRGVEARKKQKTVENVEREKIEAPRKIKKTTRKKEDLRAHVISSLPTKTTTNSMSSQKQTSTVSEPQEERPVLKELSSNIAGKQVLRTNISLKEEVKSVEHSLGGRQFHRTDNSTNQSFAEENLKECSCDYVVCWCHQRTSPSSLRRCQSESTLAGSPTEKEEKPDYLCKALKTRSRSCSPRSVRTLNYCDVGNLYESNQRNFVKVTHHSSPPKPQEDLPVDELPVKRPNSEELKRKTSERSARALQREKLRREWQLLMQDFKQISRAKIEKEKKIKPQVAIFQRARDVDERKEAKQKKLVDAFEKFLCSKMADSKIPHNNDNLEHIKEEEASVPTLNLAEYQQLDVDAQTCNPSQLTNTMQLTENVSESQVSQCLSRPADPQDTSEVSSSHRRSRSGGVSPSICQQVNSEVSASENPPPSRSAGLQATTVHRSRAGGRSPCQSSPSSHSRSGHSKSHRSRSRSRGNSQVTIHTPSNTVHIDVEGKKHHKKSCTKSQYSCPGDSSTSYASPPQNLTPSQRELVEGLLNQVSRHTLKKDLKKYILKLLSMSRESIDELNVSSGDCSNCSPQQGFKDDLTKLSNLTELYADKVNTLVDIFEEFDEQYSPDRYRSPPPAPYMQHSPHQSPTRISPQKPPSPSPPCPFDPFGSGVPGPTNPFSPGPSCPFDDQFHTPNWEMDEQFFTPQGAAPCPPPPPQSAPRGPSPTRPITPAATRPIPHRPTRKPVSSPIYDGTRARSKSPACPPQPCPPQSQSTCPPKKAAPYKTPPRKLPCALPPCHLGPCSPSPGPTTPQRGGTPTTPQRTFRPTTPQSTSRPTTPQRTFRPTTPQSTSRPTTPQRTGRPTTPHGQATQPSSSRGPSPSPPSRNLKNQLQTPFGLSSNLLPHPNEALQSQPCPSGAQTSFFTMEESEDSSIDPFAGLPCGPPASLTPLTEEELLRGIRDILPEYQEHSNFRNVREMNAAMEHFERMKRSSGQHGNEVDPCKFVEDTPCASCESCEDTSDECCCSASDEEVTDSDGLAPRVSPLNLCNIKQRLSDICLEHYNRIANLLEAKNSEDQDTLIRQVWGVDKQCFYENDKFSKVKSLALFKSLRVDSNK